MKEAHIVLASGSKARGALLRQTGLDFSIQVPKVDETGILNELRGKLGVEEIALELAQKKAMQISVLRPGALVIGGDQILSCGGTLYQKARTREAAAAVLRTLQGRMHQLVSAVCVVVDGQTIWSHVSIAHLTMKPMTDDEIIWYLARAGDEVLHAVGCYELEALGPWLFEKIDGDYFTVLGLPLLPLLGFLTEKGFGP